MPSKRVHLVSGGWILKTAVMPKLQSLPCYLCGRRKLAVAKVLRMDPQSGEYLCRECLGEYLVSRWPCLGDNDAEGRATLVQGGVSGAELLRISKTCDRRTDK